MKLLGTVEGLINSFNDRESKLFSQVRRYTSLMNDFLLDSEKSLS